jgi:hypothetical protein
MKGLPYEVKALLQKARDSAILAVETYNRPTAAFRSGAYVVLMIIAWTSLFQAIFLRRNTKPYYRKPGSRRYQRIDGDFKRWELAECLRQYYQNGNPAVRKNLEFFIALRNKIEHRSLPQLDTDIFGECQAMLMNFESILSEGFGDRYAIRGGLTFALQFARSTSKSHETSRTKPEQKSFKTVKGFVDEFRSSLSTEIQSDLGYSFKVFLVPKIGNHAAKDAVAVEWVKYDPSKPDEMKEYEKVVAMIKPKEVQVLNLGFIKPGKVVSDVADAIGKPFKMHHHVLCYRHFNVRPPKGAADPKACDTRFCVYDAAHGDYLYTDEWVKHLVSSLSDPATYDFLLTKKGDARQAVGAGAAA